MKYADNVTGETGCISKDCSLWTEGLKHRIQMHDLGTLHPKYMTYVVYNNFILLVFITAFSYLRMLLLIFSYLFSFDLIAFFKD